MIAFCKPDDRLTSNVNLQINYLLHRSFDSKFGDIAGTPTTISIMHPLHTLSFLLLTISCAAQLTLATDAPDQSESDQRHAAFIFFICIIVFVYVPYMLFTLLYSDR